MTARGKSRRPSAPASARLAVALTPAALATTTSSWTMACQVRSGAGFVLGCLYCVVDRPGCGACSLASDCVWVGRCTRQTAPLAEASAASAAANAVEISVEVAAGVASRFGLRASWGGSNRGRAGW